VETQLTVSSAGHLAFVREGELWIWEIDASDPAEAGKRVVGKDFKRQYVEHYTWSADGQRLAILLADDSSVPFREFPYYANGENRVLALTRAFPGDQTTRRRIGIVEVESEELRWLEHPAEHPVYTVAWSSSGKSLMVDSSDFFLENRSIRTYDAESGAATLFYTENESHQVNPAWSAAWAPDDRGLIIGRSPVLQLMRRICASIFSPIALTWANGSCIVFRLPAVRLNRSVVYPVRIQRFFRQTSSRRQTSSQTIRRLRISTRRALSGTLVRLA
jgi:WD40 repeat protein